MNNKEKKIFWIASYPKSGNTWLRAIISALFYSPAGVFNFNLLKHIPMFEDRGWFEFIKELNIHDYKKMHDLKVLSNYWLSAQNRIEIDKGSFAFFKTHHSCIKIDENYFANKKNTLGVIYIVRDPRDILVSFINYSKTHKNEDKQVKNILNTTLYKYNNSTNHKVMYGHLFPWDMHIESWLRLEVPIFLIKYEDLVNNLSQSILRLVDFFKKNYNLDLYDSQKIDNLVKTTNFNYMKKLENKYGFKEKLTKNDFFNKGKTGLGKQLISKKNNELLINKFKIQMNRFRYKV